MIQVFSIRPFFRGVRLALITSSLILSSTLVMAQAVNPFDSDSRAARAGGALFRSQCATCHGADAMGIQDIDAPDLTSLWALGDRADDSVFQTIRDGIPGSIMPPHLFLDTEIWMLVTYLKSLGNPSSIVSTTGDAARGAELFASNCSGCHRVKGKGGSLGPDLSVITALRSREALVSSIRDPSSVLVRRYRPVTLVTRDNQRIQGTLKSEDAFSIQLMDTSQRLRGFLKADLQEFIHEERSLMPPFESSNLSDSNLEDVLSFLQGQ
ncbi:MAG: c-type cytochrome [Gammaproteobacteria bacterium]|nr:c-type cytochrome [Gammaproteobacteria bacterium]